MNDRAQISSSRLPAYRFSPRVGAVAIRFDVSCSMSRRRYDAPPESTLNAPPHHQTESNQQGVPQP